MRYPKPALTFDKQIDLIVSRGLAVESRGRLLHWLSHISYYRLSAYFIPFKTKDDHFIAGASFDQIAGLYIFDRKLRLVLLDAIERIEVFLRTQLTYWISLGYGPFGHTDPKNFNPAFKHEGFMQELKDAEYESSESFVMHYRGKYSSEHLPLWMASELLSFGCISRLYEACHPKIKREIASGLGVQDPLLISWFRTLSYIRNVCAHHSRLWNRKLGLKPTLPNPSVNWLYQIPGNDRLYCVLVLVRHCLLRVSPQCHWRERLFALFDTHPDVELAAMGIPKDWRNLAPW
jgi:abortive infection bacteriophage resistance protein